MIIINNKLQCPICANNRVEQLECIEGYRESEFYRVFSCNDCSCHFVDPMRSDDRIYSAIYSQVAGVPGYRRYSDYAKTTAQNSDPLRFLMQTEDCYFGIGTAVAEACNGDNHKRIVEVGCGQGYLTYALRAAGYNIVGLDTSLDAIDTAREKFGDFFWHGSIEQYLQETGEKPFLIILSEVIEHVSQPVHMLNTMLDALQKGGEVVLTTPNKGAWPLGITWDTDLPPVHLTWLSETSIHKLAHATHGRARLVDLDAFYKINPKFLYVSDAAKGDRRPIFDADYALRARQPIRQVGDTIWIDYVSNLLSHRLIVVAKRLRAASQGRKAFSGNSPATLCARISRSFS